MKLYHHVERVLNELDELGKDESESLRVDELAVFDQLHYHGTDAVDDAIRETGINEQSSVLEIGSGLGGPARYIARSTGAEVTALELQEDHHLMASNLTERCGLSGKVNHLCGDILTHLWSRVEFNVIVSWLALYHIPRREHLLQKCNKLLKKQGIFYADDFYERRPFNSLERDKFYSEIYVQYLPTWRQYQKDIVDAGLDLIIVEDMSEAWTVYTGERLNLFIENKDRHLRVHGKVIFDTMCSFYEIMSQLFAEGKLGGIRIMACKS